MAALLMLISIALMFATASMAFLWQGRMDKQKKAATVITAMLAAISAAATLVAAFSI